MSDPLSPSHLAELRASFDDAFAQPASAGAEPFEDLLHLRVAGESWLAPVRGLAGISRRLNLVAAPTQVPEFLGLVAQRGRLLPAWSLRLLMGYAPGGEEQWLLIPRGPLPVALAFDDFRGHVRVPVKALAPLGARVDGALVPILDLAGVLLRIQERAARPPAAEQPE